MSSLLDPLADDPEDHIIKHPMAARLFLYRVPTSISMRDELARQFDLNTGSLRGTFESSMVKQDGTIEEWSWIMSSVDGTPLDMKEFNDFMSGVFNELSAYSPQIELLESVPDLKSTGTGAGKRSAYHTSE
jgi:hypothetical protein